MRLVSYTSGGRFVPYVAGTVITYNTYLDATTDLSFPMTRVAGIAAFHDCPVADSNSFSASEGFHYLPCWVAVNPANTTEVDVSHSGIVRG